MRNVSSIDYSNEVDPVQLPKLDLFKNDKIEKSIEVVQFIKMK